jgi:diaminohydroxyphosphoribosylaminopyrimidine deaminase/5-amino-6-(5-phosphoribosylamino)uracil reductase
MRASVDASRRGYPSPNPRVGAVVVRDGVVVSVGWHARVGDAHAEVTALAEAGERARGATVYVTLEPCNHHGRTPPCTQALIRAGVARVVYAVADPNPHVTGGGRRALEAAGVEVREGYDPESQHDAEHVLAPWRLFITRGRAHVTLKAAMTLDGRIATRTGHSQWITGEEARRDAHALRAASDAVMVGSRTVLADDPALSVRHVATTRQPVRVIVDSALVTPPSARLVATAREIPTWIVTRAGHDPAHVAHYERQGARVIALENSTEAAHLDLREVLKVLARNHIVSVMCEGGGALHGALLDAGCADRVVCYLAPMIVGGTGAPPAFGGLGVETLERAHRLTRTQTRWVGADLRIEAELSSTT